MSAGHKVCSVLCLLGNVVFAGYRIWVSCLMVSCLLVSCLLSIVFAEYRV